MSKNDVGPIHRLFNATRYSFQGLGHAWVNEGAFRLEIYLLVIIALPLGWFLGKSAVERALLIGSCLLVVVVELVNSAIEAVVDRIGKEYHELSGRAKDMGSAAVFCSLLLAAAVWLVVLFG
ncbi:MAG: diacylglycerol kinase [Deltaproteobacteria bacterium]|nr:diacylglycerol kinase [Deltaproteobacteria bacterium]